MIPSQRIMLGVASALMMLFIVDLVRRRRLREEYSMLWLAACGLLLLLAIRGDFVDWLAARLHIQHPAYALFTVALFLGMVLAVHFTIVLSRLTAQTLRLTQEVGLLRAELEERAPESGAARRVRNE